MRNISLVASQIICVVIAAIALLLTLIYAESEESIDRTTNEKEIQKGERQKNKRQLLNKRGRARVGSRVARWSAKRKIAHGKAFRRPIMFLVLMFCLHLGDAFASSIEEPSSSSSAIARSSTGVAWNDVPTIEDEHGGGDAMERTRRVVFCGRSINPVRIASQRPCSGAQSDS